MSKVIGFVIGAAQIVAGVLLLGTPFGIPLIISGSTMIVSNAVMLLTMPKAPARQASEMSLQLGEQPRSALFGECFTAGSLVDGFNHGGKYGTDWEVLLIRLADHKCEELVGFYVGDEYVEYVGDGNYPQFDGENYEHLHVYFRSDTSTQPLPSVITTEGPGWTSADVGESGCDVVVAYRCDTPNSKNPIFPGGRPRFGFVVKGKLCYDPRLDTSIGGSGSHRWDDPDTWEWTDNLAICRYNWVRGIYANDAVDDPTQLLIGRGLTETEAPPANVFAAANLCDEIVDGEARYRCDGPVYSNQTFLEVEEMFAAACAGNVVTREGSVELEPGEAKSVSFTFTDDDILVASNVSWNQGILSESSGEWVNTVVARYVEPEQKWNDHAAPVVRNTDDIRLDKKPRETSITLRMVKRASQALRVAEITRRLGRIWGRASVTLGPRFCEVEDGDWGTWTSARYGFTKTFSVDAYSINEQWHNQLTLREINSTVYNDDGVFDPDHSQAEPSPTPPAIGAPDADSWTLSAVNLGTGGALVPALVIEGTCEDELAEAIVFEYWKDDGVINPVSDPDDPAWISGGELPPSTTRVEITSVQAGEDYYAAVTYIVDGQTGDRRVLGPVTMPSAAAAGETYFANDGANYSFAGNATGPASFYDATGNKTWIAREVWTGSERAVVVQTYDHATARYSSPYTVSTECLTDDAHGVPAICMDHEGYVHCFFGAHNSAMKHSVTAAVRDPSSWTAQANIGTDTSYPHPVRMGSSLYLFVRGNTLQNLQRYKTTALSGGVATWGAVKDVVAFTGGRFYLGAPAVTGTDIHLIATYSDSTDTLRRDVYHFVYDTTDESVENSTGGVDTAVGSQPISKATADASYIVINQTTNETDLPGFCLTPDGKLHLAYIDDTVTPWDIKYVNFTGGAWSSPVTLTTTTGSASGGGYKEEIALVPMADSSVELWFPDDTNNAFSWGGDMKRMVRSSGGTWGAVTTMLAATAEGLARPAQVVNADSSLRVLFTETVATELDADAGGLKAWAYGSNGFVAAAAPVFTSPPSITSASGFYGNGDTLTVTSGVHNGSSTTYQWKRDGAAIGGATSSTYTLTGTDVGTLITVTQTATNFVGSASSTSAAVGPVVEPTYEVQTRTLSDLSNRTLSTTFSRTISNRIA